MKEGRRKLFKLVRWIILTVALISLVLTIFYVNESNNQLKQKINGLNNNIKSLESRLPKTSTNQSTSVPKSKTTPSYHVGDSQKYGDLNITLNSTGGGTTMGFLPANDTIFSVNITVENLGSYPYISQSAFVNDSFVYTQIGTDTSTGKYSLAYNTPCFGGGNVIIPPGQSLKGCVQFEVPKNSLVDTYFFKDLKWYL